MQFQDSSNPKAGVFINLTDIDHKDSDKGIRANFLNQKYYRFTYMNVEYECCLIF